MKRKFIILSFILYAFCQVLFLACNQKKETNKPAITPNVPEKPQQPEIKTRLVINNQSSAIVKAFKYSGKSLSAGEDVKIPIGEKAEIFLDDDSLSYVFFSLIDSVREKVIKVRTADVIAVKKDETKTFTILDSTTVLPIGVDENKLCTIFGILHPAMLKLMNNTFANISDISFGGKMHKETVRPGNSWDVEFNSEVSGKLSFKLWDATNKAIEVILRDEVTIKNDEVREVILKNDTLVLKGEKVEAIKTV